jgi:DNA invertase Pin-like site-specific DNA recombinase
MSIFMKSSSSSLTVEEERDLRAVGTTVLDTSVFEDRLYFYLMAMAAEREHEIIVRGIHAGIARARVSGTKSGKPIGRARVAPDKIEKIRETLATGAGILKTAKLCHTSATVVQRVKQEQAVAK